MEDVAAHNFQVQVEDELVAVEGDALSISKQEGDK